MRPTPADQTCTDVATLDRWFDRSLNATTLADVQAEGSAVSSGAPRSASVERSGEGDGQLAAHQLEDVIQLLGLHLQE
jgi:hypothetical protein